MSHQLRGWWSDRQRQVRQGWIGGYNVDAPTIAVWRRPDGTEVEVAEVTAGNETSTWEDARDCGEVVAFVRSVPDEPIERG